MPIPEKIFKIAADHDGIPFDFREDENEIVVILTDGRKLTFEKEVGTRKRVQQAEAKQAEAAFKLAETTYAIAKTTAEECLTAMQHAEVKAKRLREIADGKAPAAPAPAPEPKKAGKK